MYLLHQIKRRPVPVGISLEQIHLCLFLIQLFLRLSVRQIFISYDLPLAQFRQLERWNPLSTANIQDERRFYLREQMICFARKFKPGCPIALQITVKFVKDIQLLPPVL